MVGKTISHYKILEKLGEGGMGVVYKAEDTKLKRTVALKFLSPQALGTEDEKTRFLHEAQAAAALTHPNICTIHEIDEAEGQTFIAMECVEGQSLKEKISSGPLKLDEALGIAVQVVEGLHEAHEKRIVHRDIKSANIMVTSKGQAKIMDFGLAKLSGATKATKTGTTVGTIAYMSPEQAQGEAVDHRSDVWSLGVVLYEMLTGQLPFKGDYGEAIVYSILNEVPEPVTSLRTGVPMELERIVSKALEKDPSRRYQRMEDVLVDLRNARDRVLAKDLVQKPLGRRHRKLLVPVVVLLVVAVGLVVGIRIQIGRQPAAVAEENSLAVMYFDNLAEPEDPERLGEIVTNLLITDLSESRYVQVVSSQRLYDILKLLGREGTKVIDRDVASQVAGKANTRWMLLGSILQSEPEIILTAQLVEVSTGKAVASQRITGEPGEKIFSLVDKLVVEVKSDLSLPAAAQKEADRPVADVTTHSAEAYRYYLEGDDYQRKLYHAEAEKSYRKALEHDSTLAMAYYQLAWVERQRLRGSGRELLNEAMKYSDKVSEKERHYIGFMDAFISIESERAIAELRKIVERYPEEKDALEKLGMLHRDGGESEEAARYYQRIIEMDPLHKSSYNELAYLYDKMGDLEKSIWAINKYISLAPGEANPYDSRGELYANNGRIDQAIESYEKALEIKPDFYTSVEMLGHLHRFKREYGKAESYYRKLCSSDDKGVRSTGRTRLALIPMHQGKFEDALKVLDDGITADRMEQTEKGATAEKHWEKAGIYLDQKNPELALREARVASEIYRKAPRSQLQWRLYDVYFLAWGGKFEEAEETARALQEVIAGDPVYMQCHWWVLGEIELAKGNAEAAARYLEKAREAPAVGLEFYTAYGLAQAYLDSGRHGEAVTELEHILSSYSARRLIQSVLAVKVHYFLGLAYEESGWAKKATEQYEEFLDIWKDADPGIEEIEDARTRLARLKDAA